MPVPMTRPIRQNQTTHTQGTLARGTGTGLALPPSNGTTMPRGQGVAHTVKNPAHQIAQPTRRGVSPVAAAVA